MTAAATMSANLARMRPLWFDGRFGWLHGAQAPGGTGVVICGALAQEEVCTRYGLMLLADRLAAGGRPTLRFDYSGTGDSADAALAVETMLDDIARAVDCLRRESGVGPVVLCGLRFGATLAVKAAAQIDGVAGLALLAPIVSGAAYLRDLSVSVRFSPLALIDPVPPAESDAALNTNGFHWSADLRAAVRAVDLTTLPAPIVPTLISVPHASTRADAAVRAWHESGSKVTEIGFPDYPAFMRDPTTHEVPEATFAAVGDWVRMVPDQPMFQPTSAGVTVADRLEVKGVEERPVRLGRDGAIFGILTLPHRRPAQPIGALMLHEGSSYHIGNGRACVRLARTLAALGHPSLRVDLSGMGDSPAPTGARRPFSDPHRLDEAMAAVAALAPHAPGGIVVSGLCSGAEMAFHTALANRHIVGSVLSNMPAIGWDPVAETGQAPAPAKRTLRSSWRAVRAGGWRRVLSGEIAVLDAARGLSLRSRRVDPTDRAVAQDQMRHLANRGVRTIFLYSDDDPGLPQVCAQIGDIATFAPARIEVLARADHHFNAIDTRQRHDAIYIALLAELAEAGP